MDYANKTRAELIALCKQQNKKGYSTMKKDEIIQLLKTTEPIIPQIENTIEISQENTNGITVADFFCGAGGFSEGFYQEGFDVVFGLDCWKPAHITHEHNHPHCKTVCMNILDIQADQIDSIVPDTDIIVGSPPCVSFSNSNVSGKADKTLGLQLIHQYLKIVLYKQSKPNSRLKYWIMENVPNSLEFIQDKYTAVELGLDPSLPDLIIPCKNILLASDYGSPQGRKRAIVGNYVLPELSSLLPTHMNTILDALGPPLNKNKPINIKDPSFPITLQSNSVTDHFYDSEIPKEWADKAKRLKIDHGFMGKMDFPDRIDRLCRTIMATESYCSRESIIFQKENSTNYRAPTIRELACLMGFPIDYQFIGTNSNSKHKQIGNAVCVHLSMALANAIKQEMKLTLVKKERLLVKAQVNLNDLSTPLFANYISSPKKMNSKFHVHVPYLKLNQLRVELDNITSDFEQSVFKWRCILHKGSGKKAMQYQMNNNKVHPLISNHQTFSEMNQWLEELKHHVYDTYLFQQKHCNIETEENEDRPNHYSPTELLHHISSKIKELNIKDEFMDVDELDVAFQSKKNKYPLEILYSLYMVNAIVDQL
jgi:DNA (cytosine-5)-methyltransferase 1